jgi:hypothetical protein
MDELKSVLEVCLSLQERLSVKDADLKSQNDKVLAQCAELDELHALVDRQRTILTGVANALRGDPGPLASHSHHDLAERAAGVVTGARGMRDAIREWFIAEETLRMTPTQDQSSERAAAEQHTKALRALQEIARRINEGMERELAKAFGDL